MKLTVPESECTFCKNGWVGPGTIEASIPELQQFGVSRCPYCNGKGKYEAYEITVPDSQVKPVEQT